MEKHDLALHHAMKALILIQDELGERCDQMQAVSIEALAANQQEQDRFNVLICAYHNIAVEHEYLGHFTVAL